MIMRGLSPTVARALGWDSSNRESCAPVPASAVKCECGGFLRFDAPDPLRLGRSMQACDNRRCARSVPHPLERDPEFSPFPSPPVKKRRHASPSLGGV